MNPPSPDEFWPGHHRLLVVDDEEIVMVALSETLRRERYQVVTTMNPVTALEILGRESFSVIITDQQMPQLSGLELLAQARELQPDATRILVTAVLSLDTVIAAINKGEVYRFLVKPWLREELLVTVRNAALRYELVRKNAELQKTTQMVNTRLVQLNQSLETQVRLAAEQNQQLTRLNSTLRAEFQRGVEMGLHVIETFQPLLGTQARRVIQLCEVMARRLTLTTDQEQTLGLAARLYDLGLVGVPRELVKRWQNEPASLSQAEQALIEEHPIVSQRLASWGDPLQEAALAIRAHHERFDGEGYPDRLKGQAIPWLARLLAVAVALASSPRPGREAIEAVRRGSGTLFDPEAVQALLQSASDC
jgi:response regulator RpfG family c-di-GMP phosphodiesterase